MNPAFTDDVEERDGSEMNVDVQLQNTNAHTAADAGSLIDEENLGLLTQTESECWDVLFSAVRSRLAEIVRVPLVAAHSESELVRTRVLECVEALGQLQVMLEREREVHQAIEWRSLATCKALATSENSLRDSQALQQRARHFALHDCLTALPNRSLFRWQLERALEQAVKYRQPLAVVYLDLDGFKPINDEHGHQTGDELLKIVAVRLAQALRVDDKVGRIGGDEFACLLSDVPSRGRLDHLVRKLFEVVAAPLTIGTRSITVAPSLGIARFPVDGATADELLEKADAAMFEAKRRKSGYAFYIKQRFGFAGVANRASIVKNVVASYS